MTPTIRVKNLGKSYRVNHAEERQSYKTVHDALTRLATAPIRRWRAGGHDGTVEQFWALRDVEFDVPRGEVVGIIGRNGAGKSTLLKILSRITSPSTGRVEIRGRVSSLLEVGTGFHPELTGRENIFMNGSILGMSRREIRNKFDEIVEFSGVERFLDTPVKRYSSGMQVRLAFAVAAHLDPEILIIDEVLAVGDAAFQQKCLGKVRSFSDGGRTVLFVSHNMPAVRSITSRCLYLRNGEIVQDDATSDVIDRYLQDSWDTGAGQGEHDLDYYRRGKHDDSGVRIVGIRTYGNTDECSNSVESGDELAIQIEIESSKRIDEALVAFWLTSSNGERVATFLSHDSEFELDLRPGIQSICCKIRDLPLGPGRHAVTIGVNQGTHSKALDLIVDFPAFQVALAGIDNGELKWPNRPWGCVHWTDVQWSNGAL